MSEQKNKNKYLITFFLIGAGLAVVVGYFLIRSDILDLSKKIGEEEGVLNRENELDAEENFLTENKKIPENNFEYFDAKIEIGGKTFFVQIPTTSEAMMKGLSQKEKLEPDTGMLFVFSQVKQPAFNMKNMNFNLDFIFIENDKVVDIKEDISKDYKESIIGDKPYNQVLEITAGEIKQSGISIGNKANIIYR